MKRFDRENGEKIWSKDGTRDVERKGTNDTEEDLVTRSKGVKEDMKGDVHAATTQHHIYGIGMYVMLK